MQVGNQVGSLACLVVVMVDTTLVAANTDVSFENVALPHSCELTTCRAHVNEFVRDDRERVLFIGTQFSILYTSMYSPAKAATLKYW